MRRIFSLTLTAGTLALTLACSSVSDGNSSFWDPSRDLGGEKTGINPTGAGGSGGDAGSGGSNPGGNAGSGASGNGGASGDGSGGVAGVGGGEGGTGQGGTGQGGTGQGGTGQGGTGQGGTGQGGTGQGGTGQGGTGQGGTGQGGTGQGGTAGTGAGGTGPSTTCTLSFDVTTVTYRGRFGPKNVGAVWVMNAQNQFVKTLEVWAGIRANHLVNWQRQAAANKVDAVTAATIGNHRAHLTKWDCRDAKGAVVPNGQYKMVVEFTEDDSALFFNPQPKLFSFDFQKGAGPQTMSPPAQPNFTSMNFSIQ